MRFLVAFGLPLFFALGCAAQTGETPAQIGKTDAQIAAAWYRPTSSDADLDARGLDTLRQLDRSEFSRVVDARWAQAKVMLDKTPLVPISREQAAIFVDKKLGKMPGKTPFLARAVSYPTGEGEWTVFHQKSQLVTLHFAFGPRKKPMKPDALVVFLPARPSDIFVDCSFIKTG